MKTIYECRRCNEIFKTENELPNINRVHFVCGKGARILKFLAEFELEDFKKNDWAESPQYELKEYLFIKKRHGL